MLGLADNQKGVSMIEVLVSIAILAMIILPVSSMFLNSVRTNKNAEEVLIATQIAQRYLEDYKDKGINGADGIKSVLPLANSSTTIDDSGYQIRLSRGADVTVNNYADTFKETDMEFQILLENSGEKLFDLKNKDGLALITKISYADDNLIKLAINTGSIVVTHKAINYTSTQSITSDIDIAVQCSGVSPIKLEVTNNTVFNANILKMFGSGSNEIDMSIMAGKASMVFNQYLDVQEYNYMCPLNITVSKNGKVLAETHVLIR